MFDRPTHRETRGRDGSAQFSNDRSNRPNDGLDTGAHSVDR